jgi:hypothetical protein
VTKGVTYVPIPPGTGQNYAGLLTIDLPTTVTAGQKFSVTVRRIATRRSRFEGVPPVTTGFDVTSEPLLLAAAKSVVSQGGVHNWRYVVGTFQIDIPVETRRTLLAPERNTLAILKWRLQQLPQTDRWYPVTARYVQYISDRVDALGGDSSSIQPSPQGAPPSDHDHDEDDEDNCFDVEGQGRKDDVGLKINLRTAGGGQFVGTVEIDFKHQTLSDHRVVRNVDGSKTIAVSGLKRTPQGLYQVTVTPTAAFNPVSQFITIPASGFATVEFKMK